MSYGAILALVSLHDWVIFHSFISLSYDYIQEMKTWKNVQLTPTRYGGVRLYEQKLLKNKNDSEAYQFVTVEGENPN